MKIQADEEGKKLIQILCDAALKYGGLQNINAVNTVLSSLNKKEEPKNPDEDEK